MNKSYFKSSSCSSHISRFGENPDILRDYKNQEALTRNCTPKGLKITQKPTASRIRPSKSNESHLKRNLLLAGACLALPFAATFLYAETGAGFSEKYLQLPDIPVYQANNLLEMSTIIGFTAENVKTEKLAIMSANSESAGLSWIDPLPGSSKIGKSDYNKPSKYELNGITLELGSNTRLLYPTDDSLQTSLLVKNNGLGTLEMDYATAYAKSFDAPQIRLNGCQNEIAKGQECMYKWELPISKNPSKGTVNIIVDYGYHAELSTKLSSLEFGPLKLEKISSKSEDVEDKVGKVTYSLDIYNRGEGKMTVVSIKGIDLSGQEYNIASEATGAYSNGEKRNFSITASKSENREWLNGDRKLKIEFSYQDKFAREIEIKPSN